MFLMSTFTTKICRQYWNKKHNSFVSAKANTASGRKIENRKRKEALLG